MSGEFFGRFGVQVRESVAALLAKHVIGAVQTVGGADGQVLVDERAGTTVLTGERVVGVSEEDEGGLQALDEAVAEDARRLTEAVDAVVVRVVGRQTAGIRQKGRDVVRVCVR